MPAVVEALLARIRAEVGALPDEAVRGMAPILAAAEREVAADLRRWLRTHVVDGEERFTAQKYRSLLLQLREARGAAGERLRDEMPWWLRDLREGTEKTLKGTGRAGINLATDHLTAQVEYFLEKFGEPLEIALERGWMMQRGQHLLWKRFESSAARYAGQIGDDIKRQLAIGVTRNESFHEMGRRLVRMGGPKTARATLATEAPEAIPAAEDMAAGLFTRYEHWADRLVRTEAINTYNVVAEEGLAELNAEAEALGLPQMKLQKQWDAYHDRRLCADCRYLDGKVVGVREKFPVYDIEHPPLHPHCRCAVVAAAAEWT